jgi:hypothetical protein
MADSPLLAFYRGDGTDSRGRTLAAIQGWDDARLEAVHDYVQWVFPLPERSAFNPDAPLLTAEDVAAFRTDAVLRERLLASFRRMLAFYGFALGDADGGVQIAPTPGFRRRSDAWLRRGNHNLLRLTRILRCLTLLGLGTQARALLAALEAVDRGGAVVGPVTLRYWRDAVQDGPPERG